MSQYIKEAAGSKGAGLWECLLKWIPVTLPLMDLRVSRGVASQGHPILGGEDTQFSPTLPYFDAVYALESARHKTRTVIKKRRESTEK